MSRICFGHVQNAFWHVPIHVLTCAKARSATCPERVLSYVQNVFWTCPKRVLACAKSRSDMCQSAFWHISRTCFGHMTQNNYWHVPIHVLTCAKTRIGRCQNGEGGREGAPTFGRRCCFVHVDCHGRANLVRVPCLSSRASLFLCESEPLV